MAVRIRLKRLGRTHRPFFRVCAMDARAPRDGKVIEELGYYDPMVRETDARAILDGERIDYWLSVGAQPTEKVQTLIKKYGKNGSHVAAQQAALERVKTSKPMAPPPKPIPLPKKKEAVAEQPAAGEGDAPAASGGDAPAAEAAAE